MTCNVPKVPLSMDFNLERPCLRTCYVHIKFSDTLKKGKRDGGERGRIDGGFRFATVMLSPIALFHYYCNARRYFFAGCAPTRPSQVRIFFFADYAVDHSRGSVGVISDDRDDDERRVGGSRARASFIIWRNDESPAQYAHRPTG